MFEVIMLVAFFYAGFCQLLPAAEGGSGALEETREEEEEDRYRRDRPGHAMVKLGAAHAGAGPTRGGALMARDDRNRWWGKRRRAEIQGAVSSEA